MGLKLSFMKYLQVPPYHPGGNTQAGNILEWSEGVYLYICIFGRKRRRKCATKSEGSAQSGGFVEDGGGAKTLRLTESAPSLQAIRQEDASHSDADTQSAVGKAICGAATTNWVGNNPGILCPVEP